MKQTKHILLTAVMLLSSLSLSAHDFVKNGIYYNIPEELDFADPVVSVTFMGRYYNDYKNEYRGHVTIPSTVTYLGRTYRVTSIGAYAFYECDALTSVSIPNSVTSIGAWAFDRCGLTTLSLFPKAWLRLEMAHLHNVDL